MKIFDSRLYVLAVLYSNINIREEDNLETKRRKEEITNALNRWQRSTRRRLELLILNNFDSSAWWVRLSFRDEKLPDRREHVFSRFQYFLKKLRAAGYRDIFYVKVPEHRHGAGRWHLHCILAGVPKDAIISAWGRTYGDVHIESLDPCRVVPHRRSDGSFSQGLAAYMVKEAPDILGRHNYSCSQGRCKLQPPEIIRQRVGDDYILQAPDGCRIVERAPLAENPYGSVATLAYLKPEAWKGANGGCVPSDVE